MQHVWMTVSYSLSVHTRIAPFGVAGGIHELLQVHCSLCLVHEGWTITHTFMYTFQSGCRQLCIFLYMCMAMDYD